MESLLWVGDELAFFEVLHHFQCLNMLNEYAKTYSVKKSALYWTSPLCGTVCRHLPPLDDRSVHDVVAGPNAHDSGVTSSVYAFQELRETHTE